MLIKEGRIKAARNWTSRTERGVRAAALQPTLKEMIN